MTVYDDDRQLRFELPPRLLAFFDDHHIRTTSRKGVHRWKPGEKISAAFNARLHRHSVMLFGHHVTQLGSFSYAFSKLDVHFKAGRYCSIAADVLPMGPQHAMQYVTSSEILYRRQSIFSETFKEFGTDDWECLPNPQTPAIELGHDVWIGRNVLIRGGVSIGTGAVIAAGAVVVRDVAPYEIVGGVPARRIRFRFPEDVAQGLLDLEWWSYALPEMTDAPWNDPVKFIAWMRGAIESGRIRPFASDLGSLREILSTL